MCRPEAIHMDGQQRLLLEQGWEVLSQSKDQSPSSFASTAVIVGIGTVEYNSIAAHLGIGIYVATGIHIFHERFTGKSLISGALKNMVNNSETLLSACISALSALSKNDDR